MHFPIIRSILARVLLLVSVPTVVASATLAPMLDLKGTGTDPAAIDYAKLPVLAGSHALVTAGPQYVRDMKATIFDRAEINDGAKWNFRLHSYLAYFEGRYWIIWSHGRQIEDHPTQHVRYATSPDGLVWSEGGLVVGPSPQDGFRYIARGLWIRDGRLLALASLDEAYTDGRVHFFGPGLSLHAFEWQPAARSWTPIGMIADKAINNFAPLKMPNGEWGMICRGPEYRKDVFMLTGGVKSPADWRRSPIVTEAPADGFRPEEPDWWTLPDGRLLGLFRDNAKSGRFYRALSSDNGLTWSQPEKTNYPDATSKFFGLRTTRGYYVLVSNANPKGRNPLCLATSDDGVTFTRMGRLPVPVRAEGGAFDAAHEGGSVQYPHVIEQDGHILVTYSRGKTTVEVIKVSLDEIERLRKG
jgi:hypothetical protein